MFKFVLKLIFGTKAERDTKALEPVVDNINSYEKSIRSLTDEQLASKTNEFKKRLKDGQSLDDILPEAFAVVREAARRILGERPFDVQLMGGIVLHGGKIAEMKTGEGKTLASTMPAYLNALTGKGVHIVTVNDYLARRDRDWMGPIFEFLGLSVGVIQHDMPLQHKQMAYSCDITYGTNNEFGFDYLRDNMVPHKSMRMQRGHQFCIIDEVDSILIDEARTPLIISGPSEESTDKYYRINKIIRSLKKDEDFELDEKSKSVYLTEKGMKNVEDLLNIKNMFTPKNIEKQHLVIQALRAYHLFKRDVDYVVNDGKVIIVDEFTGRLMPGRRWSDGLHQAIEAKENAIIESENQTLASITFQNYFKIYEKISGMTGTAETESEEFMQIYKLDVVVVPTNMPMIRQDNNDRIYRTFKEKVNAITAEIDQCHRKGQPVLVGTISIEKSEILSHELKRKNIPHQVLNAKYHEQEAQIIKQAGKIGTVTIATNMAGRGTDIVLGGYPEFKEELIDNIEVDSELTKTFHQLIVLGELSQAEELFPRFKGSQKDKAIFIACKLALKKYDFDFVEKYALQLSGSLSKEIQKLNHRVRDWKNEHEEVKKQDGLHILGTERHEARRIDNQLRGRSGRQGDIGSSRFYISLDDDLMRLFGSERIGSVMQRMGLQDGQEIEHPWISRAIENAQKKVEARNFEIRKHLLEYDNVMNKQREFIYNKRNQILNEENLKEDIIEALHDTIEMKMTQIFGGRSHSDDWDLDNFNKWMLSTFGTSIAEDEFDKRGIDFSQFLELTFGTLQKLYQAREKEFGENIARDLERSIMLEIIDNKWKEHLFAMDYLKEGIGWRAYGEKDPLVEYKFEGFRLFENMVGQIKHDVLDVLYKVQPIALKEAFPVRPSEDLFSIGDAIHNEYGQFDTIKMMAKQKQQAQAPGHGQNITTPQHVRERKKMGRNEPCWCGSGKKYKFCHGKFES
ncbi:MAG: preprotein translocase subunit SecA [Spirochaetes bacterium]|nr:preprotein translocase subunit SecA [Spirochaetota bacterium]